MGTSKAADARDQVEKRSGLPTVEPIHPGQAPVAQHLLSGYWPIWELTKPVISRVHGYCLAGGVELAMMADMVVSSEDCLLGHPGVRGLGYLRNGAIRPLVIGIRKVKDLSLSSDSLTGT